MTRTTRLLQGVLTASAMLVTTQELQAQACIGQPNLAAVPRSISTAGAGTNQGRTLLARYGVAGQRVFGGVQAGYAGNEFHKPQSPVYGGDLGVVVPLGASGETQLCPVLQSLYQRGPHGSDYSFSSITSSVGLSLGRTLRLASSVVLVPFVQGGLMHLHRTFAFTSVGFGPNGEPGLGQWGQTNQYVGEAGVGFGLRLNERLTITPSYRIPVGRGNRVDIYQQTYTVSASLGFPR